MLLRNLIDRLGEVKAQIAELKALEEALKTELLTALPEPEGTGRDSLHEEGRKYRVTVSHSVRDRVDYKKLVERLKPSRQMLRSYTTQVESTLVRVSAKEESDE